MHIIVTESEDVIGKVHQDYQHFVVFLFFFPRVYLFLVRFKAPGGGGSSTCRMEHVYFSMHLTLPSFSQGSGTPIDNIGAITINLSIKHWK